MDIAAGYRDALLALDVAAMRRLAAHTMPHIQQGDGTAILTAMHMARTQAESLPLRARAYSHRWLDERGLPSQLPDALRPKAERMFPKVVSAIGVSVNFRLPELRPAKPLIERAVTDMIEDTPAAKRDDPDFMRPRIAEVKRETRRRLLGVEGRIYSYTKV